MPFPTLDQLPAHLGEENELKFTTLKLKKNGAFVVPPYGVNIVETESKGYLGLPHFSMQPDGVSETDKTAIIEVVGGARVTGDANYLGQYEEACQILLSVLKKVPDKIKEYNSDKPIDEKKKFAKINARLHKLEDVIFLYNNVLQKDIHKYNSYLFKFKLKVVATHGEWFYCVSNNSNAAAVTQLNFEVPFRNIGRKPANGESDALADAFGSQAPCFKKCRELANELIEKDFIPDEEKRTGYRGTKLAKLRSLFTLYYYIRTIQAFRDALTNEKLNIKDAFELLPKAPINDLIRTGLNYRDREILAAKTRDPLVYMPFKLKLNTHIGECLKMLSEVRKLSESDHTELFKIHDAVFVPTLFHERYAGETADSYGTALRPNAPKPLNDEAKYAQLKCRPDTPTFKPVQPTVVYYDREDRYLGQELMVLFEARHDDHAFCSVGKLFEALNDQNSTSRTQAEQKLKQLQTPKSPGPRKTRA